MIPNRIVLISRGRHDEAVSAADTYPGMCLQENSTGTVQALATIGGNFPLLVAKEEALRGLTISQKLPSGDVIPFQRPAKGDVLLMLLANGQNVLRGAALMSAGDGTLTANTGSNVSVNSYQIVAPSAVITNTNTETTFSNGSYALPANALLVGDVIRIRSRVTCVAENSTNTHRVRLYVNSTTLGDSTALQLAAADVVIFDFYLTVRTIGASGTIVMDGFMDTSVAGTHTVVGVTLASTTLDTTAIATFAIKSLASAASTGNQIRLDEYQISINRSTGVNTLVYAEEPIDNSGGTGTSGFSSAAFIRVSVP